MIVALPSARAMSLLLFSTFIISGAFEVKVIFAFDVEVTFPRDILSPTGICVFMPFQLMVFVFLMQVPVMVKVWLFVPSLIVIVAEWLPADVG